MMKCPYWFEGRESSALRGETQLGSRQWPIWFGVPKQTIPPDGLASRLANECRDQSMEDHHAAETVSGDRRVHARQNMYVLD